MSEWAEITLDNCIRFIPLLLIGLLFLTEKASHFISANDNIQQPLLKMIGYHLILLSISFFSLIEAYYYFKIFFDLRLIFLIGLLPVIVIMLALSFYYVSHRLK